MRMRLIPLSGAQFGRIDEIVYPMPPSLDDAEDQEEPL
jgi:hypothetical protein